MSGVPPDGLYSLCSPSLPLRRAQRGEKSRPSVAILPATKGVGCTVATRIGFCFEARARENDENHREYRWQSSGSGGRHLVPAREQCTSWQFHDGTDSVGGFWRHRCCGGHRLIAEGQPHAKRLRERKDTQQHRHIPISYPRSGNTTPARLGRWLLRDPTIRPPHAGWIAIGHSGLQVGDPPKGDLGDFPVRVPTNMTWYHHDQTGRISYLNVGGGASDFVCF